eukprot:gene31373-52892_t
MVSQLRHHKDNPEEGNAPPLTDHEREWAASKCTRFPPKGLDTRMRTRAAAAELSGITHPVPGTYPKVVTGRAAADSCYGHRTPG